MRKKLLGLLLAIVTFALCLLGACGSFTSDETLQIAGITHLLEPDGRTRVTIYYMDEEKMPDVFYLPRGQEGEQGETGNGIKEILYTQDEKTGKTKVTISFTDTNMEDVEFFLENGISVVGIESDVDEEGKFMQFVYSDGNKSDMIRIPNGLGIKSYDLNTEPEDKTLSAILTFVLDNGEEIVISVPAGKKGDAGRGIDSIIASEDLEEGLYILTITYTDGEKSVQMFNRPQDPSAWHNGGEKPKNNFGKNGDYFFDIIHNDIYVKENGAWSLVIDFDAGEQTCTVTFDLNDSQDEPATMAQVKSYEVQKGEYFSSTGYPFPVPTRAGYVFMGWYDSKIVGPTTGKFTTLTPVLSDLTLYAIWDKEV